MKNTAKYQLSEEQKSRYKENTRKKCEKNREDYKTAKKTNSLSSRRMSFLTEILNKMKLTRKDLTEQAGVSQQLISWWYTSDDMIYKKLIEVFQKLGYSIYATFEQPTQGQIPINTKIEKERYCIEIDENIIPIKGNSDAVLETAIKEGKPSAFVAEMIKSLDMSLVTFCDYYGVNYNSCYRWITTGNLKISHIYHLSEVTGLGIVWSVKKGSNPLNS